jgi:hypothetical protein
MKTGVMVFGAALAALLCGCAQRREVARIPGEADRGFLFVSTNGNDSWSGRLAAVNKSGTDGPFATISRAISVARESRETRGTNVQKIFIRGGVYWLTEPIVLKPEDSGLRIGASSGESPIVSGGRPIVGWKAATIGPRKYWVTEIPAVRNGQWYFRELWVNGQRRLRARHPDKGYFKIEALLDSTGSWERGHTRFRFHEGDLKAWPSVRNAEVVAMTRWVESRLPVISLDETQRVVSFSKRSVFELQPGDPYYMEGAFDALDGPGEWYLDAAKGMLYYLPMPGEQLGNFEAIAPLLPQVLRFEGRPQTSEFIYDVEFRGITFANTEWNLARAGDTNAPPGWPAPTSEVGGFAQAAVGVPAAVWCEGAHDCRFVACKFVNLGTYGLDLLRGCQGNRVSRCEFRDLGAGGIRIGETVIRTNAMELASGNEISDCTISEGGRVFQSAIGVWIGQSPNNHIAHNLIHDFYYTGISVGWTWGYGPSLAAGNLIEFNHVHHIGVQSKGDGPVLSDMGGIYTLGMQPGTRIVNNLWEDIAASRYGGWGIYFDEGSSGIVAESNVVYRTTHGGFHQHYGATNLVQNNVFAFGRDAQLQRTREEAHVSFIFRKNIVMFDSGVLLTGSWANDQYVMDHNIYWDARLGADPEAMNFAGATLPQWRARGHDVNSIVEDPMLETAGLKEVRLKPDSPALKFGFHVPQMTRVGPRP